MKKLSKVVMVMMVAVMAMAALAGCGGKDSTPEIVGTWKVSTVETAGVSVDFAKYAEQLGQDADSLVMELTAKEDKSFTMNLMGQESKGTWEEKDSKYTLTMDGEDQEVAIKDGKLTFSEEATGIKMTFEKK
ncbi:MAG: hypothetical protein RR705_00085 [Lachnospiraceae bacterium]